MRYPQAKGKKWYLVRICADKDAVLASMETMQIDEMLKSSIREVLLA